MAGIRIKKGRTKKWIVTVKEGGIARNILSDKFWMTAKDKFTDADNAALFQLTLNDGLSFYNATLGQLQVEVAGSKTTSCPDKRTVYHYDLVVMYPTGEMYPLSDGEFAVEPSVTSATTSYT